MKITETKAPTSPSALKKAKKAASAGGADFSQLLSQADAADEATTAPPVSESAPVASVGNLLSLQEVPEEEYRDRKAQAKATLTLDALENLRHRLLGGNLSMADLRTLERTLTTQRAQAAMDPQLRTILDEIELRAAVELAKLERATGAPPA